MKRLMVCCALLVPTAGYGATCDELTVAFGKYDNVILMMDVGTGGTGDFVKRLSYQATITNVMARQSMVLDMMIAQDCELPDPPSFPSLGFIEGMN